VEFAGSHHPLLGGSALHAMFCFAKNILFHNFRTGGFSVYVFLSLQLFSMVEEGSVPTKRIRNRQSRGRGLRKTTGW
jgi:hypothetical protein